MDQLMRDRERRKQLLLRYINKTPDFFENKEKHLILFAISVRVSPAKAKEYYKELEAIDFGEKKPETKADDES